MPFETTTDRNRYPAVIDNEGEVDLDRLEALEEFFAIVKALRKTQKDYFSTRNQTTLEKSKRLERIVDRKIGELSYPLGRIN